MKSLSVICLIALVSCAHNRAPSSENTPYVAKDSMALGNVKASAVKTASKDNVCFDVTLTMKGTPQDEASASNWTMAWVDQNSQYHLLNPSQRDPASVPQGGQVVAPYGAYQEWTNTFRTCAPEASMKNVKSLVLTPKNTTYKDKDGLRLVWD